jgi:hypothetical protein
MSQLTVIGLAQLVFLAMFPAGVFLLLKKRPFARILGVALLVPGSFAIYSIKYMWPFDYFNPNTPTRVSYSTEDMTYEALQYADIDFYSCYFVAIRKNGQQAKRLIDSDCDMWWRPAFVKKGDRLYLYTFTSDSLELSAYIDTRNRYFYARGRGEMPFGDEDFV